MTRRQRTFRSLGLVLMTILSGCSRAPVSPPEIPVSVAPEPRRSGPSENVADALKCISRTGAFNTTKFAVAVHADGTGKQNASVEGATGAFLPQGTTASFVSEAILRAGGVAQNYYELNTERAIRQFAGPDINQNLVQKQGAAEPDFIVSSSFTALDFLGGPSLDVRVGGVGPRAMERGAQIEVVVELYRPGDRTIVGMSSMTRQVLYTETGVGVARIVGPGSGTLITGDIGYSDQQRMQESTRDAVELAVADILSSIPGVNPECGRKVKAISEPSRSTPS